MLKMFFPLACCAFMLSGCDDPPAGTTQENTATNHDDAPVQMERQDAIESRPTDFKSGNFFYIARDVAEMQLRAGDYIQQLKQSQTELQQAIQDKNSAQLQQTATTLQQQFKGFNQTLNSLHLKSQEIEDIRQKLLESNRHVLKSPFLNGQVNWNQVNFRQIEQQMNNIQTEMFKLASMMLPQSDSAPSDSSDSEEPEQETSS